MRRRDLKSQRDDMPASPDQRTVLVTGAARRIGRELALALARDGWQVAVHYRRSRDEAMALAGEIEAGGGRAVAIDADLADHQAVASLIQRCADRLGAPSCLINNASEFLLDSIETLTPERWQTHLDINLRAPVFLAKALAECLPVGMQGNVINIIDQRVWQLTPEFFSYTVSKAGLWSATRMLAQALAPRIRVNAIGPGPVLQSVHQSVQDFAKETASTLLARATAPSEIAAAVRFILDAPAMTGQMIALDAGQHLSWAGMAASGDGIGGSTPPSRS